MTVALWITCLLLLALLGITWQRLLEYKKTIETLDLKVKLLIMRVAGVEKGKPLVAFDPTQSECFLCQEDPVCPLHFPRKEER